MTKTNTDLPVIACTFWRRQRIRKEMKEGGKDKREWGREERKEEGKKKAWNRPWWDYLHHYPWQTTNQAPFFPRADYSHQPLEPEVRSQQWGVAGGFWAQQKHDLLSILSICQRTVFYHVENRLYIGHSDNRTGLEGHSEIQTGDGGAWISTVIEQQNVDRLG